MLSFGEEGRIQQLERLVKELQAKVMFLEIQVAQKRPRGRPRKDVQNAETDAERRPASGN